MTLTEANYWTRKLGVIFLVVFILFILSVLIYVNIPSSTTISEYQRANYACTDLKEDFIKNKLSIPSLTLAPGSDLVYEIETRTGKAESLPRIVNVYKYTIAGQSLNSQTEAKLLADRLDFDPDTIQRRGSTEYVWYDSKTYRTLVIDARNLNFTLSTDYSKDIAVNRENKLPTDNEAKQIALTFLSSKGLLFDDLKTVEPYIIPVNIRPDGTLEQAKSRAEAELLRVSLFRNVSMISIRSDYAESNKMKIDLEKKGLISTTDSINTSRGRVDVFNFNTEAVYENMYNHNITILVGPRNDLNKQMDNINKNIYGATYRYWPVPAQPCGTYQLIPASIAIDAVQKGKGSLIYLNDKNGDEILPYTPKKVRKFTIYDINIKYYESFNEQKFLQPIYLISGEATFDNGIIGVFHYYVPAIDYEAVENKRIEAPVIQEETSIF